MNERFSMISRIIEAGGQMRVRSALNPILWLCGIVSAPALVSATWSGTNNILIYILAAAPLAVALFGFLFLLFFDRDKLQSEEYQIRKRSLEIIEQKGDPTPVLSNVNVTLIPDPSSPTALSEGDDK